MRPLSIREALSAGGCGGPSTGSDVKMLSDCVINFVKKGEVKLYK